MQVVISLNVLAALADIADKANGNKYSGKIHFMPGLDRAIVCNGPMLAAVNGLKFIEGTVGVTISSARCKAILIEAKALNLKGEAEIILCDDYDTVAKHKKDGDTPYEMFAFVAGTDYPADTINALLTAPEAGTIPYLPRLNIKYQLRVAKLWKALAKIRHADVYAPRYDSVYRTPQDAVHFVAECAGGKSMHAIIMAYRR